MARRPVRNCKCYTLSALAASLAVSAAVSVALIEMSPARINFSIAKSTQNTASDGGLELSISLAAKNTSPRTLVLYRSIYIVFCNMDARDLDGVICIGTDVAPMPLHQKPKSAELINATAVLEGADSPWVALGIMPSKESFIGNKSFIDRIFVNVSALVSFKRPGIRWTSLRDIRVSCTPVAFISQANKSSVGVADKGLILCH